MSAKDLQADIWRPTGKVAEVPEPDIWGFDEIAW
jgi:hypothetical protein